MIEAMQEHRYALWTISDYPDDLKITPWPGPNVVVEHKFFASSEAEVVYALHEVLKLAKNVRLLSGLEDDRRLSDSEIARLKQKLKEALHG